MKIDLKYLIISLVACYVLIYLLFSFLFFDLYWLKDISQWVILDRVTFLIGNVPVLMLVTLMYGLIEES